jgi:hypothetical protein
MTPPEKRKVSARQILSDIRAGMHGQELKEKHRLSDKSLETVLRKLSSANLLTEAEIRTLSRVAPKVSERPTVSNARRKCPACDAPLGPDDQECAACGVVVAKFAARREQRRTVGINSLESEAITKKHWLLWCCIVAAAVVTAGGLLVWWKGKPQPSGATLKQPPVTAKAGGYKKLKEGKAPKTPNIFAMKEGELLRLSFIREGFPLGLSVTQGSGGIHFFETPDPNQGFKKLPPETGAKRYYDQFKIAGRTFPMVTEGSNPPKIYLDVNRNGDMTDDPGPFEGEGPNVAPNHYTLELPHDGEETLAPYRLWLFPSRMGGIHFYPHCHWLGRLEIGGTTYKFFTFDANSDGDYSNDPMVIDADNDGKASEDERLRPGQRITIDGTEVKLLGIAPSGRWIRLLRQSPS